MDRRIALAFASTVGCGAPAMNGVETSDGTATTSSDGATATSATDGATSTTNGDSTGDPPPGHCVDMPTIVVDPSAVGITGVSAMEVLEEVEGIYTGSITFSNDTPAGYSGSTTPSPMTLEIRYDGGEMRSVDAVLVSPCDHDGPCPCEDSFEIDVTWRLVSMDGVLDESWVAPVVHEPTSFFMASDIGISHEFQPDDTTGTMSAASFDLTDGWTLRRLVAHAELDSGAAQGSISTEIEMLGGLGYGPVAHFAGVREVSGVTCNALSGETACEASGCVAIIGQRVSGTEPPCGCNSPETYCFAAPLEGDAIATKYTREYVGVDETSDEVVWFPTLADPPPEPWRLCSDAPEVVQCACTDECEG